MDRVDGTPRAIYSSLDASGGAKRRLPPKRTSTDRDRAPLKSPPNAHPAVNQSKELPAVYNAAKGPGSGSGKGRAVREVGTFDQARGSKQVTFSQSQFSSDCQVGKASASFAQEGPAAKSPVTTPKQDPLSLAQQPQMAGQGSESRLAGNNVRLDPRSSYDDGSSDGTQMTCLVEYGTNCGAEQLDS